jgi:Phage P22-like portal protein
MQREPDDINHENISDEDINEMEERRIAEMEAHGIDEEHVLQESHKDMQNWISYFQENITRGKSDQIFATRTQWSAVELQEAQRLKINLMTFNKIYDPIKKILGEQRRNKPDLMVRSLNGKVDQEELDLRQDLIRTISYSSQNDLVYQTAFKSALLTGFGAFQVGLDYESHKSFNKKITYNLIPDASRCFWDPSALMPHKGDGNYCGRTYIMSRDEFFATYPYVTNPISFADPYMLVDYQWQTKDTICIGEIYKKEWYPLVIIQLSNGMSVTEDEWEEAQKAHKKQLDIVKGSIVAQIIEDGIPTVVGKRQTQDYRIMRYLMLKNCIIDFSEWPCNQLPIIFVDGDSYYEDGRQRTKSFIHESIDAQKSLNFFNSQVVTEAKNRRREQWLGTADNIVGYEQIWRNPEVQVGMLPARPDPKTGQMPIKQPAWEISQSFTVNAQRSAQDIKEILGFSEQEVLNSRDLSGKARRERKLEGGLAAYIYFDNLNEAIAQSGRVISGLLPYIIGSDERNLPLTKNDGKVSNVIFNHKQKDGSVKNKLSEGEFDIEISAGPSFAVQKEIAVEMMQSFIQANPEQLVPLLGDLYVKQLDLEFMPQLVERLRTLVPPPILAKEDGTPVPPAPPNPQAMMAQQQMKMQQQEAQQKAAELHLKMTQVQNQKQNDERQHQLDAARIQNEAIDLLGKLQENKDKHDLGKAKLIADLTKIASGHASDEMGHAIDLHKKHLDHSIEVHEIANLPE